MPAARRLIAPLTVAVLLTGCGAGSGPDAPAESAPGGINSAVPTPRPDDGAVDEGSSDANAGVLLVGTDMFTPHATCVLSPSGRVDASISVSAAEDGDLLLFVEGRTDGTGSAEMWMADGSTVYAEHGTWDADAQQLQLSEFGLIVDSSGAVLGSGRIHGGSGDITVQVQAVC